MKAVGCGGRRERNHGLVCHSDFLYHGAQSSSVSGEVEWCGYRVGTTRSQGTLSLQELTHSFLLRLWKHLLVTVFGSTAGEQSPVTFYFVSCSIKRLQDYWKDFQILGGSTGSYNENSLCPPLPLKSRTCRSRAWLEPSSPRVCVLIYLSVNCHPKPWDMIDFRPPPLCQQIYNIKQLSDFLLGISKSIIILQ